MNDRFVVRVVVVGLALTVLACIVASVVLTLAGEDFPEFLKYVGTTALGVFGGILAKTSTEPQPVQVVDQPVATQEVAPKRKRGDAGAVTLEGILIALVIVAVAFWLGLAFHPLWFLLLLLWALIVIVLIVLVVRALL